MPRMRTSWLPFAACLAAVAGCPAPETPVDCEAVGPFSVHASVRNGEAELEDGAEVAVFTPPQLGIATELDVRFSGVQRDELRNVRVDVLDLAGELLAAEMYVGEGLPFTCEDGGVLLLRAMPVPFAFDLELEELDGVEATLRLRAESETDEVAELERAVTLRVASY